MVARTPIFEKIVKEGIKNLKEKYFKDSSEFKQITLGTEFNRIYTRAVTEILFSIIDEEVADDIIEKVEESTNLSIVTLMNPLFLVTSGFADKLGLISAGNRVRKLDSELRTRIMKIYNKRLTVPEEELGPNVIDLIIKRNRTEEQAGRTENIMKPSEIAGTCMVFLLLANDPARSITEAGLFLLSDHQKERERMYNTSMKEVFGKKEGNDYENSEYMNNFVDEVLRLYNPGTRTFVRKIMKNSKIGGLKLYKGDCVVVPLGGFHTNDKYHEDGETFNPDRFIKLNSLPASQKSLKYMPFGGGIRRCPGQFFSKTVIKIILANFIKEFEFERADNFEPHWAEASVYKLEVCTIKIRPRRV